MCLNGDNGDADCGCAKAAADRVAEAVLLDKYQRSEPCSVGGIATGGLMSTGRYEIRNPFSTPAEFAILAVAFGGAGQAIVSASPVGSVPGNTGSIEQSAGKGLCVFASAGADTKIPNEGWFPVQSGGSVFLTVSAGTNAVFLTVQFRRRVDHAGTFQQGEPYA